MSVTKQAIKEPYAMSQDAVWPPPPTNQPDNGWGPSLPMFNFTDQLARWVVGLLLANIPFDVIGMLLDPWHTPIVLLVNGLISGLQSLLEFGTGIVFFVWAYQSYRNLSTFQVTGLRMTPGWVIGYFFIPFLNLVRPYTAFKEIWQGSTPCVSVDVSKEWKSIRISPIVLSWWLLWLMANILSYAGAFAAQDTGSSIYVVVTEAYHLVSIAAAVCAVFVVRGITARQAAKWQEIVAHQPATGLPTAYPCH